MFEAALDDAGALADWSWTCTGGWGLVGVGSTVDCWWAIVGLATGIKPVAATVKVLGWGGWLIIGISGSQDV